MIQQQAVDVSTEASKAEHGFMIISLAEGEKTVRQHHEC